MTETPHPSERASVEAALRAFFGADPHGVSVAYLFGSVARGDDRPRSDVDIAVLFDQTPPATLEGVPVGLWGELETILHRPVDLVVLNTAPPDLRFRVIRDGKLVLERSASRRVRFEVETWKEYWDLLPYLRLYRHAQAKVRQT